MAAPNFLPEPRFQLKFVRFLILGSLVQVALLCAVLFFFVGETYRVLAAHGGVDPRVWPLLHRQLYILIALLAALFFLYVATVAAMGLFYSHRIGGVIFALKRNLNDLAAGRYQELRLRRNDEFQDITDAFNRLVRRLKSVPGGDGESPGSEQAAG